jgi:predicted nucleotidyltransferase
MDLRRLLGVKVDLVSEGALTGRFGQMVREEAVPL